MLSALLNFIKNNLNAILLTVIFVLLGILIWRYYKLLKLKKQKLNIENDSALELMDIEDETENNDQTNIETDEDTIQTQTQTPYEKISTQEELNNLKTQEEETDDNFDLNIDNIELSDTTEEDDVKSELIEEINSNNDEETQVAPKETPNENHNEIQETPKENLIEEFKQSINENTNENTNERPKIKLNFKK